MSIDPLLLLRKLEPPIRPAGRRTTAPGQPFERQDFQTLLASVRDAGRSDRPINVSASLHEPLTDDQQERLAVAADVATAHGARTALLLMDGRGLVLDVGGRDITSELLGVDGGNVIDLDVAVYVADDDVPRGAPPWPGNGLVPPAIAIARGQLNTPSDSMIKTNTAPIERGGAID